MKTILATPLTLASLNASAIAFITEAQVQEELSATSVIEVTKATAEKLVEKGSMCERLLTSRSARAYAVKKDGQSVLFVTPESLINLRPCGEI